MPRSLMLRMALDHAAQILREFWVSCLLVLHLAHTPPPAQELSCGTQQVSNRPSSSNLELSSMPTVICDTATPDLTYERYLSHPAGVPDEREARVKRKRQTRVRGGHSSVWGM